MGREGNEGREKMKRLRERDEKELARVGALQNSRQIDVKANKDHRRHSPIERNSTQLLEN